MKFSIVTPVYNGEKYLADTIKSVLSQEGDFEIEYIIQDGGSQDKTLEIAKSYAEQINSGKFPIRCKKITVKYFSEKDKGMYDAINKGFARTTGEVCAYINADDIYLPNAFMVVAETFRKFPQIMWVTGATLYDYEDNRTAQKIPMCYIYNQEWIARGVYGRNAYFIHQDSVFWKKQLAVEAGSIPSYLRYAGDYYLWTKFARITELWSINFPISRFRIRAGQLSADMTPYRKEQKMISGEKIPSSFLIKIFFSLRNIFQQKWLLIFFKIIYRSIFFKRNKQYIGIKNLDPEMRTAEYYELPIENL
ncbi:MAG: glycosyltransferase family 2 protein [bacterium]|nr:glycosyltransferase family 2 protein [bacterium]